MERRWGIESHLLGANELRALAPALSETMIGADFVPAEGYGDPLRGTMAVLRLALRHGARLLRGADVLAIERDGAAWRVATSKGPVIAGRVVNATGPWAARIGRMVGLDLPVTGTVQQVIVTEHAPPMTRHLIALANRHLSLKQQTSGGFLVGGGWFGGLRPGERAHAQSAPQHRGQFIGLRTRAAGAAEPARRAGLDRDQSGDRPRTDPGRGTRPAGVLQHRHGEWLHAGAGGGAHHG